MGFTPPAVEAQPEVSSRNLPPMLAVFSRLVSLATASLFSSLAARTSYRSTVSLPAFGNSLATNSPGDLVGGEDHFTSLYLVWESD
jgi:hypothetical protein